LRERDYKDNLYNLRKLSPYQRLKVEIMINIMHAVSIARNDPEVSKSNEER
jgi:hypothetical protein